VVAYDLVSAVDRRFFAELDRLIREGASNICDVGGGAHPSVGLARIQEAGLRYVVFDVSEEELDKAPAGYTPFQGSALDRARVGELLAQHGPFDLVTSRWTAEHMQDGRLFHEMVYSLLRPGGAAVHLFPTLYSFPFLFNRIMDNGLSAPILARVQPKRQSKFPAYYSWCRGPSARQLQRLQSLGYEVELYLGGYGHNYYRRVPPLHALYSRVVRWQLRHPHPLLTCLALVVLRRPD
jgi:hypothetical protein